MDLKAPLAAICLILLFMKVKTEKETLSGHDLKTTQKKNCSIEKIQWIEQKLDNFDENDNRTWKMRYMSNDEYFQAGSPVFIVVGGEWEIKPCVTTGGHIYDMAKEHQGYIFATEHRFYGESRPTSDFSTENLKYLNVKQALADLAHFIRTMKATVPGMAESKFILKGCSYAGTMVTWFRKLYPDLAVGSWALSAPLVYKINFYEYTEVVGESIRKVGGENCYNRIENAFKRIQSDFANKMDNEVEVCGHMDQTNDFDVWTMISKIMETFDDIVQHHQFQNHTIQNACKIIMDAQDDVKGVENFFIDYKIRECKKKEKSNSKECKTKCLDYTYKFFIEELMNTTYTNRMDRQWAYQTCNEFGNFQTLDSRKQPFGSKLPLKFLISTCKIFGEQFTEDYVSKQVQATNDYFGGLEPNVENVYFTQGELDPWRTLGIQDSRATIIPMHAHCSDKGSISDSDTTELRASKERIAQLVREWVGAEKSNELE